MAKNEPNESRVWEHIENNERNRQIKRLKTTRLFSFEVENNFRCVKYNSMSTSTVLLFSGSMLVLHAAYSCLHYRELFTDLEESGQIVTETVSSSSPPVDILIELVLAFLMVLSAELLREGSGLHPVTSLKRKNPLVAPSYVSRDFDTYTTRGRSC